RYANQEITPAILASNVLRNVGIQLGTPWTAANAAIERTVESAHALMGIAPDDPRSTWPMTRFAVIRPVASEDSVGNGLHLVLVLVAVIAAAGRWATAVLRRYAACLVAAFLLFCLLLRWQPWHSRLLLPLFVLGAAPVGVVLAQRGRKLIAVVALALMASSAYFLAGRAHAVVRDAAVFRSWAGQRAAPEYVAAARFLASRDCRRLG